MGSDATRSDFFPTLEFFVARRRETAARWSGSDSSRCPSSRATAGAALARIVGRSLALFSWLGVSDLHWENLVLGVGDRGRVVFAPLDIEMILADLSLPTETKLLPDADPEYAAICRHACGVRRVLPYLGKPVDPADLLAMAGAYHAHARLSRSSRDARSPTCSRACPDLRETPIRVCLRGTGEYVRARTEPLWPPLLDAEAEQLARGDIPYFFRLYGRPGIHYYGESRAHRARRGSRSRGDVPQLDPVLSISRGLRSPSRKKLREEGLFTLLGAFDHPSLAGKHESDELEVTFGARTLVVKLPSGEELQSRRDLSAFVGSVYLPCRCGEVRSVFVPPVTVCEAGHQARRAGTNSACALAKAVLASRRSWTLRPVTPAIARPSPACAIASSRTRPSGAFSSCSTRRSRTRSSARRRSWSRACRRRSSSWA